MRIRGILAGFLALAGCASLDSHETVARLLSPHESRLVEILAETSGGASAVDGHEVAAQGAATGDLPRRWRRAEVNLFLDEAGPARPDARFLLPGTDTFETRVNLGYLPLLPVTVSVSCDAPAYMSGLGGGGNGSIRAGRARQFTLPASSRARAWLELGPEVQSCVVGWGAGHSVTLVRQDDARPDLAELDARTDLCAAPDPAGLDALERVFYSDRWLSQTCAVAPGPVRLLDDPIAAFNARAEALMGKPLGRAALVSGDPDMPLDFSNAPDLQLITISYLIMRADYSGHLITRMLEWHAARGTEIRILLTSKLMRGLDRNLFEGLAARYPNVQVQYFTWETPNGVFPVSSIDRIQRAHHIKVFSTIAYEPGRSRFIVGGRNLWDGFVFQEPFDLPGHPELRSYDREAMQGLMYYSTYEDFEIEIAGDRAVEAATAHFATFWHRDKDTQAARPMAVTDPARRGSARSGMRHYISIPWADGEAQLHWIVDLMDAAQREIFIVTPFLYPPQPILDAWLRARARGVEVRMVARINSTDPSGVFIKSLNTSFVRRWAGDFEIHEFVPAGEDKMMHTKLIMIDGRLSVVTSTNMNRRSFHHDTENGLVFLDRTVTRQLLGVVDRYLETANRRDPGGEPDALEKFMSGLGGLVQYF